jgi:hypothetical protein
MAAKKPKPKPVKNQHKPPGPKPEVLVIEGNWKDAMRKLVSKKRPIDGWPKPDQS